MYCPDGTTRYGLSWPESLIIGRWLARENFRGVFGCDYIVEMAENTKTIQRGTHYFKNSKPVNTCARIPHNRWERERFKDVVDNMLDTAVMILDHIGSNLMVTPGAFLARIVSLGKERQHVVQGVGKGKEAIELTLK